MNFDKPAKVISGSVIDVSHPELWPYHNNDDYWSGGSNPRSYRWTATFSVEPSSHSDTTTRVPYTYNGIDIKVGDYAGDSTGRVLKIIAVEYKMEEEIKVRLEDVNRVNTFSDPSRLANGGFSPGMPVVFFEVTDEGNPVLNPFPSNLTATTYVNIAGRFDRSNPGYFFQMVHPSAVNLEDGEFIAISNDGNFVKTSRENNLVVGKVTYLNKAAQTFAFAPINKILDSYPYLPGEVGDILYSSFAGDILATEGEVPVVVKIRESTPTSFTGFGVGPTTPGGKFKLNGVEVTVGGEGKTDDLVEAINDLGPMHGLIAEAIVSGSSGSSTTAKTTFAQTAYGEPAAFLSSSTLSARINGVLVNFTTMIDGMDAMGEPVALGTDFVVDINNANIPNVTAIYGAGVEITNASGGITIENVSPDDSGYPFAGPNSCSGLPLITEGSVSTGNEEKKIKISAPDARAISFTTTPSGTVLTDFGLYDSENGQKAAGIYISGSSGMKTSSSTVVPNMAARNLLSATVGDQAMVLNKGDGEWGLYLHDGSNWIPIASQESAETDARTVTVVVTPTSATSGFICEMNGGSSVTSISVNVVTAFDGNPSLTVGDSTRVDRLMGANESDPLTLGKYVCTPNFFYPDTGGDVDVRYGFDPGGSTVGLIRLSVTYV